MSKTNDTSRSGRATQVRELRDDELQKVSGGYTFNDVMVKSIVAGGGSVASGFIVVTKPTDVASTK